MSAQWHYNLNGQNLGPIDSSKLQSLAANGTITRDTLIWKDGMKDWVPANKIKDLFPSTPPPSLPITKGPPPLPKSSAAVNRVSNESVVAAKKMAVDDVTDIERKFPLQRIAIIAAAFFEMLATFLPWGWMKRKQGFVGVVAVIALIVFFITLNTSSKTKPPFSVQDVVSAIGEKPTFLKRDQAVYDQKLSILHFRRSH